VTYVKPEGCINLMLEENPTFDHKKSRMHA